MVDLLRDLPPGHEFFERFSFISSEDLPEYQAAIRRVEAGGLRSGRARRPQPPVVAAVQAAFRRATGWVSSTRASSAVCCRLGAPLPKACRRTCADAVAFFDADAYNPAASVQDNILFGKLVYGRQQAQRQIGALIAERRRRTRPAGARSSISVSISRSASAAAGCRRRSGRSWRSPARC